MFRALTTLTAIVALAVSAAPVASAFERSNAPFTVDMAKKPPPGLLVGGSGGAGSLGRTSKAGPSKPPRVNQQGITLAHEGFKLRVVAKPKPLAEEMTEELHAIRR